MYEVKAHKYHQFCGILQKFCVSPIKILKKKRKKLEFLFLILQVGGFAVRKPLGVYNHHTDAIKNPCRVFRELIGL